LAEYEIRRVVRRLEGLEDAAARARLELSEETRLQHRGASTEWQLGRLAEYLSEQEVLLRRAESEIGRLERRLDELVATEKESLS
jgi:hypothetical protein